MKSPKRTRLGLTMRSAPCPQHGEARDALARDWHAFMASALPEAAWLPVPNLGPGVGTFARSWELDGFVFTGGDDLGASPERDATEEALLDYARQEGLPVFGVCRGLQMICRCLGGILTPCDGHAGTVHEAVVCCASVTSGQCSAGPEAGVRVNSFHRYAVAERNVPAGLTVLVRSPDGFAEAVRGADGLLLAVQWHPERPGGDVGLGRMLFRNHFGYE